MRFSVFIQIAAIDSAAINRLQKRPSVLASFFSQRLYEERSLKKWSGCQNKMISLATETHSIYLTTFVRIDAHTHRKWK